MSDIEENENFLTRNFNDSFFICYIKRVGKYEDCLNQLNLITKYSSVRIRKRKFVPDLQSDSE